MKYFMLAIIIATMCSCSEPKQSEKKDLAILSQFIGSWSIRNDTVVYTEKWAKISDTLFSGTAYELLKGDTTFKEKLIISIDTSGIYYSALVSGQNDNKPVKFRYCKDSSGVFIFENQEHDFPKKLIYNFSKTNILNITVTGQINGAPVMDEYKLEKQN